jgi:hypothetical protein
MNNLLAGNLRESCRLQPDGLLHRSWAQLSSMPLLESYSRSGASQLNFRVDVQLKDRLQPEGYQKVMEKG